MFGEIFGAWIVAVWRGMGEPDFKLVELGPGRGTLMADVIRVLEAGGAREAAEIWLVEMSPALRAEQANRVPGAHWVVGIMGDQLIWGLSAPMDEGSGEPGAWTEVSPQTDIVSSAIARRLRDGPGAALIVDYGYREDDRPKGPTLQAVRGHKHADPLQEPGQSALTWLVDFDALAGVFQAAGHKVALTEQGAFLTALGIGHRAAALAETDPDQAETIADALERLTDSAQMGTLFKVLTAVSTGLPTPPGFEELP
jgi:SAM-dependent MidA family methyltransferase